MGILISRVASYVLFSGRPDAIHRATIRLTDIANLLNTDWEQLAEELNIPPNDVALIKQEYPDKPAQQAAAMFKIWQNNGNKATGEYYGLHNNSSRVCIAYTNARGKRIGRIFGKWD